MLGRPTQVHDGGGQIPGEHLHVAEQHLTLRVGGLAAFGDVQVVGGYVVRDVQAPLQNRSVHVTEGSAVPHPFGLFHTGGARYVLRHLVQATRSRAGQRGRRGCPGHGEILNTGRGQRRVGQAQAVIETTQIYGELRRQPVDGRHLNRLADPGAQAGEPLRGVLGTAQHPEFVGGFAACPEDQFESRQGFGVDGVEDLLGVAASALPAHRLSQGHARSEIVAARQGGAGQPFGQLEVPQEHRLPGSARQIGDGWRGVTVEGQGRQSQSVHE